MKRVVIQGNPSSEEQALILARVHLMQVQADATASDVASSQARPSAWIQAARSEQLNRWPQSAEDRFWHT